VFTGIVEECGVIRTVSQRPQGLELRLAAPLTGADLRTGDSLAVDGVCLTAETVSAGEVTVVAAAETLAVTTLGSAAAGRRVHLERALRVGDRLGGHIVQGHVDGIGRLARRTDEGGSPLLEIEAPPAVARYLIVKGSIAVDGVSLTINRVAGARFEVLLVPHTVAVTHLGDVRPGDALNLEADLLAKYVEKLLAGTDSAARAPTPAPTLTLEKLRAHGYLGEKG